MCCAMTLLPLTAPPSRQPNKYFLELLFTFPNLVVFLTYAIMWRTGSFLFGPAGSQQPSVPTYWQALDLESTVVIVIYASSDDRCAHIVLSIRLRQLKVIARLGFNQCIFPRKWYCHHISQLIQSDHEGLLLYSVTDKIQSLQSSEPQKGCAREISGKNAIINSRPFSESGCDVPHFISRDILSSLIKRRTWCFGRKTWQRQVYVDILYNPLSKFSEL